MVKRSAPKEALAASAEATADAPATKRSAEATADAPATKRARVGGVVGFYGHKPGTTYREFSNFYDHGKTPFTFELPSFAKKKGFPESVQCEFSEKAIMVTKAAIFNDRTSFNRMLKAKKPKIVKDLGRGVSPFDNKIWSEHLEEVAFEVVRQKFASDPALAKVLLDTGDATIAEATKTDKLWGIGIEVGDPRVQDPAQWQGRNVLGTALMKARTFLRQKAKKAAV